MTQLYVLIVVLCIYAQPCQSGQSVPTTLEKCYEGMRIADAYLKYKMEELDYIVPYAIQTRCVKFEGESA